VIRGNYIYKSGAANNHRGIALSGAHNVLVTANLIDSPADDGISLSACDNCTVIGNVITRPGYIESTACGILVTDYCHYCNISGNTVRIGENYHSGTAQAGGAASITLSAEASALNDLYNTWYVYLYSGAGSPNNKAITDYDGTTKVATVAAWAPSAQPDATTKYRIYGGTAGAFGIRIISGYDNLVINNDIIGWAAGTGFLDGGTSTITASANRESQCDS